MRVIVRYFAAARECSGTAEEWWEIPASTTVGMLWQKIIDRHPALAALQRSMSYAVNREYVSSDHALAEGDELALIPPVSGG